MADTEIEMEPGAVPETPDVVDDVLTRLLGRRPRGNVTEKWRDRIDRGMSARRFIDVLSGSEAYQAKPQVGTHSPAGHYYSPIVDPEQIRDYYDQSIATPIESIIAGGIPVDLDAMMAFWEKNREFISASPWSPNPESGHRYFYDGGPYPRGDANTVRAMINHFRPKQVIEVGSGFSSAAMLDTADELGLDDFKLTCIEPYPGRLKGQLREQDYARVEIIEAGVQTVPLERFDALERGDICFIDSTHVLKTGSDVHYELFHILPRLKPGVMVHFHDCRFPFEYSTIQVFDKNYSWNEVYAVRALLMNSNKFRIFFWGSLFARQFPDVVLRTLPAYSTNPGSALWIETVA